MEKKPVLLRKDIKRHSCQVPYRYHMHGAAIDECFEDNNFYLFVSNGEYGSQVNYCPVCGYEAKKRIEG